MKNRGSWFIKTTFVFTLFFLCISGSAQSSKRRAKVEKPDTIRLFILGNSFSVDATIYLPEIAREKGKTLIIGRAELGGCSLKRHWDLSQMAENYPDLPDGMAYKGKSLRMLLEEETWDIVTMQQYSKESCWMKTYIPYARNLYNYIKEIQPDAKVVFHQTWAYRSDSKDFCLIEGDCYVGSEKEMWKNSRAAYRRVASELDIDVIPVGDAFWKVSSGSLAYRRDVTFDYENPVYPDLPDQTHSLHKGYIWRNNETFSFDSHHASNAGQYLGSLVWYGYIFKESPLKITHTPEFISPDFAAYLRKTAHKVVKSK